MPHLHYIIYHCYIFRTLNILILNAGVFAIPYELTQDGFETTFQVNHLSQFYFTLLLKGPLQNCHNSRVVIVTSESHRYLKHFNKYNIAYII